MTHHDTPAGFPLSHTPQVEWNDDMDTLLVRRYRSGALIGEIAAELDVTPLQAATRLDSVGEEPPFEIWERGHQAEPLSDL